MSSSQIASEGEPPKRISAQGVTLDAQRCDLHT
jgi:hypothetical protein